MGEESWGAWGRWISSIYRCSQRYLDESFREHGIGGGLYIYILALYREDGVSQRHLADLLPVDEATAMRATRKLMGLGLVERKDDPDDRRAYRLYLTRKARDIEPEIKKVLSGWNDLITADFTGEQRELAHEMLRQMAGNASLWMEGVTRK